MGLRRFRLFTRELQHPAASTAGGLRIDFATELQVVDLCGRPELDLRAESVGAAFQRGDLCALAYDGKHLAGYCWFAFAPLRHLDDVWARFGAEVVWTYKSLVLQDYRGRGIAGMLYRFADGACLARNRRRSIICVESHNEGSASAALKAGYVDAGSAAYIRRGGLFLEWYSPRQLSHAVSFYVPGHPQ